MRSATLIGAALALAGCTAVTNVDRFQFGAAPDSGQDAGTSSDAGPGDGSVDSGRDLPDGGPTGDAGQVDGGVSDLPVLEANAPGDPTTPTSPSLGCLGTRTGPIAGPTVDFELTVDAFLGPSGGGEGMRVQTFANNLLPADLSCGAGCMESTVDAASRVAMSGMEGSWFAWRVLSRAGSTPEERTVLTAQVNEVAPAESGSTQIYYTQESSITDIRDAFTGPSRAGTDVVAGTVTDCDDNELTSVEIRVFDDSGRVTVGDGAGDGHFAVLALDPFGWDGSRELTVPGGNYAFGNLMPSGSRRVRVEAWGRPSAGGPEVMLSCEEATLYGNGLFILNLGPARSDGPTGCSGG